MEGKIGLCMEMWTTGPVKLLLVNKDPAQLSAGYLRCKSVTRQGESAIIEEFRPRIRSK